MTRYFFDVDNGRPAVGPVKVALRDIEAAKVEAAKLAGEILKDGAAQFVRGGDWGVKVADEAGVLLFKIAITSVDPPAPSSVT